MLIKQPEDDAHSGTGLPSKCKSINISYWLRCLPVICLHELKQNQFFWSKRFFSGENQLFEELWHMAGGGVDASLRAAGNGSMPLKKDLSFKNSYSLWVRLEPALPSSCHYWLQPFLEQKDISVCCIDSCKQSCDPLPPQVLWSHRCLVSLCARKHACPLI